VQAIGVEQLELFLASFGERSLLDVLVAADELGEIFFILPVSGSSRFSSRSMTGILGGARCSAMR
jgi:hypothetical protein